MSGTMSQDSKVYGIHLAQCLAQNCPCPNLTKRINGDLKSRGVKTALAEDVYPPVGETREYFFRFTAQSAFTIIPVCDSTGESFRSCIQNAVRYSQRFCIVLSEKVLELPDYLREIRRQPLYNFHETTRYEKLIEWFDQQIANTSLRLPKQEATSPQDSVPERQASVLPETLLPTQTSNRSLHFENPDSSYSSYSVFNINQGKFVSLPNLDELDSHHPDCGPIARRHCTAIDEDSRKVWMKDLTQNRLYLRINHCETNESKRDVTIFFFQIFCRRKLDISLPLAIQLIKCRDDGLRTLGIGYMECKLLRWEVVLMQDKFDQLVSAEEELFYFLNEDDLYSSIPSEYSSRVTCLYMLILSLLCSGLSLQSRETNDSVRRDLKRRALCVSVGSNGEESIIHDCHKAIERMLQQAIDIKDKTSVIVRVSKFQKVLGNYFRDKDEKSFKDLKRMIGDIQPKGLMDRLKTRKPERLILRQLTIRALVASLKDRCGRVDESASSIDDMEHIYVSSMLALLRMSLEIGTSGLPFVWRELFKQELRPLMNHKNATIAKEVRKIVQYDSIPMEQSEEISHMRFSEMFSTVGLEWHRPCVGQLCKVAAGQRWRHYLGKIGGSITSNLTGQFASIIYNPFRDNDYSEGNNMYEYGFSGDNKYKTECKLLGSIDHSPHIVQLLALNAASDGFLYVLERPSGGSLQQILLDRRFQANWLSLVELKNIAIQVIQAVDFCHQRGILHRDIRTENFIYCNNSKVVKLDNFGLGSFFDGGTAKSDVDENEVAILWASPETLREGKTSPGSDIWMLGQTLLELYLHGSWPYSERLKQYKLHDVVKWIAYKGIRPLEPTGCVPSEILRAIFSCLEMEEKKRPTASDLLRDRIVNRSVNIADFRIEGLSLDQLPYQSLSETQEDAFSKPTKGIPVEIKMFDPTNSSEDTVVPDPWEGRIIEEDDPEFQYLADNLVIKERPFYPHTSDEVECLSKSTPGLVRLKEQSWHVDGTTLTCEWPCPEAKMLNEFIWTYQNYQSPEFINLILNVFIDVTGSLRILHKNRCIHRDICARHILVDVKEKRGCLYRIARVRQIRVKGEINPGFRENANLQAKFSRRVRWFPAEVLRDSHFSRESDVYMLAVTIWEVFNNINNRRQRRKEEVPFSRVPLENLADRLANGETLPKPDTCPEWLYKVLQKCWSLVSVERPSMSDIQSCLNQRENLLTSVRRRYPKSPRNKDVFSAGFNDSVWFTGQETFPKRRYGSESHEFILRGNGQGGTALRSSNLPLSNMERMSRALSQVSSSGSSTPASRDGHAELVPESDTVTDDVLSADEGLSYVNQPEATSHEYCALYDHDKTKKSIK